jgi:TRAP-type uncharacterized transport system substrate-binding protein
VTSPEPAGQRKPPRGPRDLAGILALTAILVVIGFAVTYRFVAPAPPRSVVLAAGEEGGAYTLFASRYREFLSDYGIDLEIRSSAGSLENLALLRSRAADVALVQGGVTDPATSPELVSLGSLFYEPLWVFLREGFEAEQLSDLAGARLGVGPEGSGTRILVARLLAMNGITPDAARWVAATGEEGMRALHTGGLDALFLIASERSPIVQSLLEAEDVRLLGMERATAYTRLLQTLSRVVLPQGVVDLTRNVPPEDRVLVSSVAGLVAHEDFHPALVDLLLQGAAEVHGQGGLFAEPGEFPSPRYVELPLNPDAARYYRYGPPLLQRYLPFWAATQIDRLKVMLIPLIALLIPLVRMLPPTYRWRVRSRIYRWYGELRELDPGPRAEDLAPLDRERRLTSLERIEAEVTAVPTPLSYASELYDLRLHIELVRGRLQPKREP